MAVPSDLLHTFYTMDSYSVVSCSSEAGVTSHHTKIERNNLQPHWNERCIFQDVALSNSLTVAIFDHKKLSSDLFLGQVCLSRFASFAQVTLCKSQSRGLHALFAICICQSSGCA